MEKGKNGVMNADGRSDGNRRRSLRLEAMPLKTALQKQFLRK